MADYRLTHLKHLESESIYVIRETAAQFEKSALLFSGGKDSIVLLRLAQSAFYPAKLPFPLLHIDTGHNFPETLEFRDQLVQKVGAMCRWKSTTTKWPPPVRPRSTCATRR